MCTDRFKMSLEHASGSKPLVCVGLQRLIGCFKYTVCHRGQNDNAWVKLIQKPVFLRAAENVRGAIQSFIYNYNPVELNINL